jgi:hypothetical protein
MTGSAGQAGITGASTSSVVEFSFGGALNQYQEGGVYGTGTEKGFYGSTGCTSIGARHTCNVVLRFLSYLAMTSK